MASVDRKFEKVLDESVVQLFIERFLIVVCATAFYGLIINNTMGLDIHQRISLGIVLVGAAYFLGHTAHKGNRPAPITITAPKDAPTVSGNASSGGDHSVANTGNGNTIKQSSPPAKEPPKKE